MTGIIYKTVSMTKEVSGKAVGESEMIKAPSDGGDGRRQKALPCVCFLSKQTAGERSELSADVWAPR